MKDLKEEFGFTIGPWNQAYQVMPCHATISLLIMDMLYVSAV